jgi:WD40 repeat protein
VDGSIRLWDVATGKERPMGTDLITAMALSPDGAFLLTAGRDQAIRTWDPRTGKLLREWKGETNRQVRSPAVARGGKLVAAVITSRGAESLIDIWDPTQD